MRYLAELSIRAHRNPNVYCTSRGRSPICADVRLPRQEHGTISSLRVCTAHPFSCRAATQLAVPIPSVRPSGAGLRFRRREPAPPYLPGFGGTAGVAVYKLVSRRSIAAIPIRNILSLLARASHHVHHTKHTCCATQEHAMRPASLLNANRARAGVAGCHFSRCQNARDGLASRAVGGGTWARLCLLPSPAPWPSARGRRGPLLAPEPTSFTCTSSAFCVNLPG
jgi:hypothetical protein